MRRPQVVLVSVIGVLWLSNIVVSSMLGLGDAEALYYLYSRHLALSYLDHPPLIGLLIRFSTAVAGGTVLGVRLVPMGMSALCLLFAYCCTSDMFGKKAAVICVLLMVASPVFSIGMTAASPDAPLAALVMLFVWRLHRAVTDTSEGRASRLMQQAVLGGVLGLAFLAKYTGACLVISVFAVLAQKEHRHFFKHPGFYLAGFIAATGSLPVFVWNYQHEWAGVLHRLVYTQGEAGFSLRNAGALIGGQLLYVGPLVLWLFGSALLHHKNATDKMSAAHRARRLLIAVSLPTLVITYLIVCWSKAAEPHWPAAGYLPLFPLAAGFVAQARPSVQRLFRWTVGFGAVVFAVAHIVVLSPLVPAFVPQKMYEPKYDLANELRGWDEAAALLRAVNPEKKPVVAAFYTQCSQLAFHLNRAEDPKVRCVSPELDDFDIWDGAFAPGKKGAFFVTDNRFDHRSNDFFTDGKIVSKVSLSIKRAGVEVRRFQIVELGWAWAGGPGQSGLDGK